MSDKNCPGKTCASVIQDKNFETAESDPALRAPDASLAERRDSAGEATESHVGHNAAAKGASVQDMQTMDQIGEQSLKHQADCQCSPQIGRPR